MTPANYPLYVARNVPFAEQLDFAEDGNPLDFTGWTGALQVRLYGGATGAALISLATVQADVQGVRFLPGGGVQIMIDEASIAALPGIGLPDPGGRQRFSYDLVLTDASGFQQQFAAGEFIVSPGVTK